MNFVQQRELCFEDFFLHAVLDAHVVFRTNKCSAVGKDAHDSPSPDVYVDNPDVYVDNPDVYVENPVPFGRL